MLLVDAMSWWYTRGWGWVTHQLFVVRSAKLLHFFSVSDMAKTLFSPFRQDAIDTKRAPVGVKLQAFGGNIISRIFGFIIRSMLIAIGSLAVMFNVMISLCVILVWPLIPLAPIVSVVLFVLGVTAV